MDKNKAKELSDILLAYSKGKIIQKELVGNIWKNIIELSGEDVRQATIMIRGEYLNLRIKPELKLVPFTFEDNKLFRDKWIKCIGSDKELFQIIIINETFVCVELLDVPVLYQSLLDCFEFEDGSPCGKYIEE